MGGFSILWMTPWAPSCQLTYWLDTMNFRVGIQANNDPVCQPEDFKVELWTNLYHKESNEGEWHAVPLPYLSTECVKDNNLVIFYYGADLIMTCLGRYDFTFRARHKFSNQYEWADWIHVDGHVEVRLPVSKYSTWVQEPEASKVTHNIWIGNYTAAMEAPDNGYDCILNMSDDAHIFPQQLSKPVIFKKIPLPFGADKVISDQNISCAVRWLRAMSDRCNKILVTSKEGNGRSGSILIAYIYATNPNLSFEEAYQFVDDRHFVYTSKGLRDCLRRLYPRD